MPVNYAGNPASFPAQYATPSDGDAPNASSVNAGLEALGDRTAYLQAQLGVSASRCFGWTNWDSLKWIFDSSPPGSRFLEQSPESNGSTDDEIWGRIDVPHGRSITRVDVYLSGPAHGGPTPAVAAMVRLIRVDVAAMGAAYALVQEQLDDTTIMGNYEADHTLTMTLGAPYVVDNTAESYYVCIRGESGANAVNELAVYPLIKVYYS